VDKVPNFIHNNQVMKVITDYRGE